MQFNKINFVKSVLPAYVFPALMAGTSGLLSNNATLIHSSYTYIALSTLFASSLCYLILWKISFVGDFLRYKILRVLCLWMVSISLSVGAIYIFNLFPNTFDIILSVSIGSIVTVWRQPIQMEVVHEHI